MGGARWTPFEDDYLREHYNCDSAAAIAQALSRQVRSVYARASKLGLSKYIRWSASEDALLQGPERRPAAEVAAELERTVGSIYKRAHRLAIRGGWPEEDLETLRRMYGKQSVRQIAEALGRSHSGVYYRASELGLSSAKVLPRKAWTAEEEAELTKRYAQVPARELAAATGRSLSSLTHKARRLGLTAADRRWTAAEDATLRASYATTTAVLLGESLGRSEDAVQLRAALLELPHKQTRWTAEQDAYLTAHSDLPLSELTSKLSRSKDAVKKRKSNLGLTKTYGWDEWEIEELKRQYINHSVATISAALGRPINTVYRQLTKLGLARKEGK